MSRLLPDLEVTVMPHGLGLQIRGTQRPYIIRGEAAERAWDYLQSHLPGSEDPEHLILNCPEALRPSLQQLVSWLQKQRLFADPSNRPTRDPDHDVGKVLGRQCLFWSRQGFSQGQSNLQNSHVVLVGNGMFGAVTADLLLRSGVGHLTVFSSPDDFLMLEVVDLNPAQTSLLSVEDWSVVETMAIPSVSSSDLLISATRHAPEGVLQDLNQLALEHDQVWLTANEESGTYEVGPVIFPRRTACYTCLQLRRQSRDPFAVENAFYDQQRTQPGEGPQGEALPAATLAAGLVVTEACRILIGDHPQLVNSSLTINWSLNPKRHTVLRVPRCPDCYTGKQIYVPETTVV